MSRCEIWDWFPVNVGLYAAYIRSEFQRTHRDGTLAEKKWAFVRPEEVGISKCMYVSVMHSEINYHVQRYYTPSSLPTGGLEHCSSCMWLSFSNFIKPRSHQIKMTLVDRNIAKRGWADVRVVLQIPNVKVPLCFTNQLSREWSFILVGADELGRLQSEGTAVITVGISMQGTW